MENTEYIFFVLHIFGIPFVKHDLKPLTNTAFMTYHKRRKHFTFFACLAVIVNVQLHIFFLIDKQLKKSSATD